MNKKLSLIGVVLTIALIFTACGGSVDSRSTGEILSSAFSKSLEMKSAKSSSDIHISVDVPESIKAQMASEAGDDANVQLLLSAFSDSNIHMDMVSMMDPVAYSANIDYKSAGDSLNFKTDFYMKSPTEYIIKNPFADNYVVYDMLEQASGMDMPIASPVDVDLDPEMIKKYQDVFVELYGKLFKGEEAEKKLEKIALPDGEKELTVLTFDYSGEKVYELADRVAENVVNADLYSTAKKILALQGMDAEMLGTEESFKNNLTQFKSVYDMQKEALFEEAKKNVTINKLVFSLAADENDYLVYSKMDIDLVVKVPDGESGATVDLPIKMTMDTKVSDINKVEKIDIPELTDANTITVEELGQALQENMFNAE